MGGSKYFILTLSWSHMHTCYKVYVGPTEWSPCSVGGKVLRSAHPTHVTGVAEEVAVQREALRARFIRELFSTLLHRGRRNNCKVVVHH